MIYEEMGEAASEGKSEGLGSFCSQAALVVMLEPFLMNIDVLFMIFLSQSACQFNFSSFKLSFTLFIIMSAALCYAIMLFIFYSTLNTTDVALLYLS